MFYCGVIAAIASGIGVPPQFEKCQVVSHLKKKSDGKKKEISQNLSENTPCLVTRLFLTHSTKLKRLVRASHKACYTRLVTHG